MKMRQALEIAGLINEISPEDLRELRDHIDEELKAFDSFEEKAERPRKSAPAALKKRPYHKKDKCLCGKPAHHRGRCFNYSKLKSAKDQPEYAAKLKSDDAYMAKANSTAGDE